MAISLLARLARTRPQLDIRHTLWLWPYLLGMAVISYLGQYGGGIALIPLWVDIAVVVVFSIAIFAWAVTSVRPTTQVRASVEGDIDKDVTELPTSTTEV